MSNTTPPGYYHADGDPEQTVRYWDGTKWAGEPMPSPSASPAALHPERFAGFWIRLAARILDGLVGSIIVVPLMLVADTAGSLSLIVAASILLFVIQISMVAKLGGTPGKLIVGLRVTLADGSTTPPGFKAAILRVLPEFLTAPIPLLPFVIVILNIIFVLTDDEKRSVNDRVGSTRVVKASALSN